MCDDQGWIGQTGRPVIVDMGFKREDVALNAERCVTDGDCQFEGCSISGENTMEAYCSGVMDPKRDCSKGECVCVASLSDEGNFDCPMNKQRRECLDIWTETTRSKTWKG